MSVPSNIAEGQARFSQKEFKDFLSQARGSPVEIETQLLISQSLGYLPAKSTQVLMNAAAEVGKVLNGLIASIKLPGELEGPSLRTENRELVLVASSCPFDAFVDGLASSEAFFSAVPVRDFLFSEFPAQQNNFAFDFAGEVEESDVEVFDLNAGGVDFGDGILHALQCLLAFSFAAGELRYVHECSAIQEDAVAERFEFGVNFFDEFLALNRGA